MKILGRVKKPKEKKPPPKKPLACTCDYCKRHPGAVH